MMKLWGRLHIKKANFIGYAGKIEHQFGFSTIYFTQKPADYKIFEKNGKSG